MKFHPLLHLGGVSVSKCFKGLEVLQKQAMRESTVLLSSATRCCEAFFRKLHHVHGENIQLERFRQLEMWSRSDRIDEILDGHSHLSDVFVKTELYHEDSAIDLIQQQG